MANIHLDVDELENAVENLNMDPNLPPGVPAAAVPPPDDRLLLMQQQVAFINQVPPDFICRTFCRSVRDVCGIGNYWGSKLEAANIIYAHQLTEKLVNCHNNLAEFKAWFKLTVNPVYNTYVESVQNCYNCLNKTCGNPLH